MYAKNSSKKKALKSSSVKECSSTSGALSPHAIIDIYFTFLSDVHPLIEKEKLKYFVNNCLDKFENKSELELEDNIWIKSIEEMKCIYAFYLTLMVVSSQLVANLEVVDIYLKKAE